MKRIAVVSLLGAAGTLAGFLLTYPHVYARAAESQVARGKYLVTIASCSDCHTPGQLRGQPDMSHFLGGSDTGFDIPGLGVFYGRNLTPDQATGLGSWSTADIVRALKTGVRPDRRELAPVMPWRAFSILTDADAEAIAAYLKTLPPVSNKVPGPFGPNEKPTGFVSKVVAADAQTAAR